MTEPSNNTVPHCSIDEIQWGKSEAVNINSSQFVDINKNISTTTEGITVAVLDEEGGSVAAGNVILYYSAGNKSSIQLMLKNLNNINLYATIKWISIS